MGGEFLHIFFYFSWLIEVCQVASGIMFNVWDAHYRSVNVLRFTECGSALLSGSEDSAVSVWSLSRSVSAAHARRPIHLSFRNLDYSTISHKTNS